MRTTDVENVAAPVLARALAGALLCVSGLASLASLHWRFEMLMHLGPQLAVSAVLVACLLAFWRAWRWSAALGLAALLTGWTVVPTLTSVESPGDPTGDTFSVYYSNVLRNNPSSTELTRQLNGVQADLVFLAEVDEQWLRDVRPALTDYPNRVEHPLDNNFGVALYSRFPLADAQLVELTPKLSLEVPTVLGTIEVGGQRVRVIGVHVVPPVTGFYADVRGQQLVALATLVQNSDDPVVVLGDLNLTPYPGSYRDFEAAAGLTNAAAGKGPLGTWPSWAPALFRAPIDHVLVRGLVVERFGLLKPMGSDHLPLFAELGTVE